MNDLRSPLELADPEPRAIASSARSSSWASGLRADTLQQARGNPMSVITDYEDFKRKYQPPGDTETTEKQCEAQGLRFIPMVVESHAGGWGKEALRIIDGIAKASAVVWPDEVEHASLRIAQRLSISLHRANSRAIMKRLSARDCETSRTCLRKRIRQKK